MLIDIKKCEMIRELGFKGGKGTTDMYKYAEDNKRFIEIHVHDGSSIGEHVHADNFEVMFVVSGFGRAICDGKTELLSPGKCHYCPKGSSHSIENTGLVDLVLYAVVADTDK